MAATKGRLAVLPTTFTHSPETQQKFSGDVGLRTYHQLASPFLPTTSVLCPGSRCAPTGQMISGPPRQLTATLLGLAWGPPVLTPGAGSENGVAVFTRAGCGATINVAVG